METIQRTYKVYSFKELKEAARQKAIECFSEINVDHDWWENDYLLDSVLSKKTKQDLKLLMFENGKKDNMMFNWDRLSFDLDRGHYLQFQDLKVLHPKLFYKMLKVPKRCWDEIEIRFTNDRDCYTQLEWYSSDGNDLSERFDKLTERADGIFRGLMESAWNYLRDSFDNLTSEKEIVETIKANEYQFLKDGTVFN